MHGQYEAEIIPSHSTSPVLKRSMAARASSTYTEPGRLNQPMKLSSVGRMKETDRIDIAIADTSTHILPNHITELILPEDGPLV